MEIRILYPNAVSDAMLHVFNSESDSEEVSFVAILS